MSLKTVIDTVSAHLNLVTIGFSAIPFLAFFGIQIVSPKQQLEKHIEQSSLVHDSLQVAMSRLEKRQDKYDFLIDALVRGECIKNTRENLARQGLMQKCTAEGIVPQR